MRIYVGVAGWSYKDWEGSVYPVKKQRTQHPLEYVAALVDTVEINTSFYGHINPAQAKKWCESVAAVNRNFLFTAKLNRCFTHSPMAVVQPTSAATIVPNSEDELLAKRGLDSIAEEGKLGALLIQFPISFKNTPENRDYLNRLMTRFEQYPLAVEVRHATWDEPELLQQFRERHVAFCNIDQPLLGKAIAPSAYATSPVGYIRLHGRNYEQWFEHEQAHERYNYLYSEQQLAKWKPRIESVSRIAEKTFVVANNHFQGKAVVNSLQLRQLLGMPPRQVPESLRQHYPVLASLSAVAKA